MDHHLSHPVLLDRLDPGSREWTITRLTINAMVRDLEACAPSAGAVVGGSLAPVFEDFYATLLATRHDLDWTLPLELGRYLRTDSGEVWSELAVASVVRWLRRAEYGFTWVALRVEQAPYRFFLGRRKRSLGEENELFACADDDADPDSASTSISYARGRGEAPEAASDIAWQPYHPLL